MTTAEPKPTILVASDLSPRSDRATDRAIALAEAWGTRLVAVHALPPESKVLPGGSGSPHPEVTARRRLAAEFAVLGDRAILVVADGRPAEVVARYAKEQDCGLIVTGVAREETIGRMFLGDTVDDILRRSTSPVLVVKNRPRGDYRTLVLATDFSDRSRLALDTALALFQPERLVLFHGYSTPLAGITGDPASYRRQYGDGVVRKDCEAFVAKLDLPERLRNGLDMVLQDGFPGQLLAEYVETHPADLVVVGARGQSPLREIVLGSTAKEILATVCCDTLVVRR
ncbi:universal stress protein [Geminicoccus flavidas]|uniref:universal stress protein n=1 Tax=Geminicoccus flavidas TaxID=2506407 RepID=UPI00135BED8A|nr:universal stress protein [Geminicoccus flavidas]